MADVKVALVGFGDAGRQHLQALGGTVGACPVAVVEDDREAAAVARAAGLQTRDMGQVLADESIRLVALCRPPRVPSAVNQDPFGGRQAPSPRRAICRPMARS
ncbi:hypothetical protein AB0I94_36845 [Streptomyces sp. NPDC050147]|uniref:hypothetical protein n=1 Tax=Streptomyces sp. NPDC050147 TaxID=3155513 RepID=UPI00342FC938